MKKLLERLLDLDIEEKEQILLELAARINACTDALSHDESAQARKDRKQCLLHANALIDDDEELTEYFDSLVI